MKDVEHPHSIDSVFSVKTAVFEGPMELLIELIEKRKLLVNDISLAAVTDEYMQKVAVMEQNPLRETTQFVLLAATLLLIKSKSLLPVLQLTEEEEGTIDDLQTRLKQYAIFRNAGKTLSDIFGVHTQYERQFVQNTEPLFVTDKYADTNILAYALSNVINNLPKKVERPKVKVRVTVSLEEMIDRLKLRVEKQMKFRFNDFAGESKERGTVIIGFLAVLEMVKQGSIIVRQTVRYDNFEIENEGTGTPSYT